MLSCGSLIPSNDFSVVILRLWFVASTSILSAKGDVPMGSWLGAWFAILNSMSTIFTWRSDWERSEWPRHTNGNWSVRDWPNTFRTVVQWWVPFVWLKINDESYEDARLLDHDEIVLSYLYPRFVVFCSAGLVHILLFRGVALKAWDCVNRHWQVLVWLSPSFLSFHLVVAEGFQAWLLCLWFG